jgi:hypothetical protein
MYVRKVGSLEGNRANLGILCLMLATQRAKKHDDSDFVVALVTLRRKPSPARTSPFLPWCSIPYYSPCVCGLAMGEGCDLNTLLSITLSRLRRV